jgi:hypothetical protein
MAVTPNEAQPPWPMIRELGLAEEGTEPMPSLLSVNQASVNSMPTTSIFS